jgi:hypothetical protein
MSTQQQELQELVMFLTQEKGLKIVDIVDKIGIDQAKYQNVRRSSQGKKVDALTASIKAAFPQFLDGEKPLPAFTKEDNKDSKYMKLLEAENERLKEENSKLIDALIAKVK